MEEFINDVKLADLYRNITEALEHGTLESQMDVIKLKAADLGLDSSELQKLIETEKLKQVSATKIKPVVLSNKKYIFSAIIIALILELFIPVGWFLKVIIMLVTCAVIIFVASAILSKKIKK